jgi:hypothetical protein
VSVRKTTGSIKGGTGDLWRKERRKRRCCNNNIIIIIKKKI